MVNIPATMQVIAVENAGKDSTLRIEQRAVPQPSAEQLLVKVAAAGINRADLMQRRGLYPPPEGESDILGLEVAGVVVAAGHAAVGPVRRTAGLPPGDGRHHADHLRNGTRPGVG